MISRKKKISFPNRKWKQVGKVFLWTYLENKKNYPGWHLSVDEQGAESLLNLFKEMTIFKSSTYGKIEINQPTVEILKKPNNKNGKAKWLSPDFVLLKYLTKNNYQDFWTIQIEGNTVIINCGKEKLSEFKQGIINLTNFYGDFSIGPDKSICANDQCIWFW